MSTTAAVQADALLLQLVTATTVCGSFFILLVLSLVSFINSSSSSTSPLYSTLHTFGHNSIHNRPSVHHLTRPEASSLLVDDMRIKINPPRMHFSNAVPVVQSSGCQKSNAQVVGDQRRLRGRFECSAL